VGTGNFLGKGGEENAAESSVWDRHGAKGGRMMKGSRDKGVGTHHRKSERRMRGCSCRGRHPVMWEGAGPLTCKTRIFASVT
jgi:hypothetical protein